MFHQWRWPDGEDCVLLRAHLDPDAAEPVDVPRLCLQTPPAQENHISSKEVHQASQKKSICCSLKYTYTAATD